MTWLTVVIVASIETLISRCVVTEVGGRRDEPAHIRRPGEAVATITCAYSCGRSRGFYIHS